ncbi:hypothetical protein G3I48_26430 [Streptomyces griseus]|uniref:restriction endonuclease subunit S n=1 Tax=Streptomyces griseus TaxID=1911 RepID=UPI0013B9951C|nr:hypothetical protein [Streptomyces griseus]
MTKTVPLRRLVDVIDCAHVTAPFIDDDRRFPVASIRECQGAYVDLSNCKYTTQEFFDHLRASDRAPLTGDLLFIRNVSVGLVSAVAPGTPDFAVGQETVLLRRTSDVDPTFLRYALVGAEASHAIESAMIGSTFRRINVSAIRALPVALPPAEEQRLIANYLDRETARIDTLIEEQKRLIGLFRERRDSAWTASYESAQRLGRPVNVRRVIESIADGPFGSSLTSAHYSNEGARVIRLGNIGVNEFRDGDAAFIPLEYADELEAHAVEQGDVVVAGLGDDKMPLGRAAVVPAIGPAIVKADCYRVRPNALVSADYLAWIMSAPQTRSQIMRLARGATRARLNTKVVQQVEIPLPDLDVQHMLVARSAAETEKIDALVAETERFIELSRERRSALITAAVTGQIDVREAA